MHPKNGVTVLASGGIGNQLFILAAGLEAAMRLSCPLYIDAGDYSGEAIRAFELDLLPLELAPVPVYVVNANPRNRHLVARVSRRIEPLLLPSRFFLESSKTAQKEKWTPRLGWEMRGYFQSHKFWSDSRDLVLEMLWKSDTYRLAKLGTRTEKQTHLAIQVRQGDYLVPKVRDLYGVCSFEYFERAYNLVALLQETASVTIHSDSPENMQGLLERLPRSARIEDKPFSSSLEALVNFSLASSFVISNSSFGWWGASLGQFVNQGGSVSHVVAPRPWVLNKDLADTTDLLPFDWMTLDNRTTSLEAGRDNDSSNS